MRRSVSDQIRKRTKKSDTGLEKLLRGVLDEMGERYEWGLEPIPIAGTKYSLRPDILMKKARAVIVETQRMVDIDFQKPEQFAAAAQEIFLEADGKDHFTKDGRQKTKWRDSIIVASGRKVIHVYWRVLVLKSKREALKVRLRSAINSSKQVEIVNLRSLKDPSPALEKLQQLE